MYKHGVSVTELKTPMPAQITGTAALQVVIGTAPINLLSNPAQAVNKIFVVKDLDDMKRKLGYSDDVEQYTLCQSAYLNFKVFNTSPVIMINVLDPSTHKTENTEKEYTVAKRQVKLDQKGILLESISVKNEDTALTKGTDYIATFDDNGYAIITLLAEAEIAKIKVTSTSIDASQVTASDIIGSVNSLTGACTGLELVKKIYPTYNLTPGILLCPGMSTNASVSAAMELKCNEINGCFRCIAIVDINASTVKKYSDVEQAKKTAGLNAKELTAVWPMYKKDDHIFSMSTALAASMCLIDSQNDFVPCKSPSNKELFADAIVLADGTEVNLDFTEANELNRVGVVTAINRNGWRAWGNNTTAYDDDLQQQDPVERWINVRRFFSWWSNRFIIDNLDSVDENPTEQMLESIIDAENILCNSYIANGYVAGASIRLVTEESDLVNGSLVFEQQLAAYTPAEIISNKLVYNVDLLNNTLGGE